MNFLSKLIKIANSGQARAVILTGNIYDLFFDGEKYVPLMDFLKAKMRADPIKDKQKGLTQLIYKVNRPIEVAERDREKELDTIWSRYHPGTKMFSERLSESTDNAVYGLELLRQITECTRKYKAAENNLLVLIEAADMLLPETEISRMMLVDRKRLSIVQDWFGDPDFISGHDTVIMIAESRSNIHHRVARLPQVVSVEIPLPDKTERWQFIVNDPAAVEFKKEHMSDLPDKLAGQTAGLSLHAIRQLLLSRDYSAANVAAKVEEYMISQLGDGVVEFKRPTHNLKDVIGFTLLKKFIEAELIPGFEATGDAAISGALVGGPIGAGKTFICEAVAAELEFPVLVLKNIRSKWFGETDAIFERLRRLLESLDKSMVFMDEADTVFGGIQSDHDTERRLTGKFQAMMSDPALKGRVIWFLMTARVHLMSPDIRRPGRMNLIIPILDPEDDDRIAFIKWATGQLYGDNRAEWLELTKGYSSASFELLRATLKTKKPVNFLDAKAIVEDMVPPDIEETRNYQTLQVQVNCTRKSLLVPTTVSRRDFEMRRGQWKEKITKMEAKGMK